ncbi:hypothetical protein [Candidatus Symbiopectobacterium endolongispinus]|uniref:hypothetical protein n=1 Tax=Candidatus Symbiopectobacterium endolongispinus TaxID=2812664 RepID=UPI00207956AD|nr:hypothetical protein [Candidatus Symbiopectobacterium endolongispinus]MBT9428924.1 hypothetical protein [Candidatus Symbiopectobacterium endolongispinus]
MNHPDFIHANVKSKLISDGFDISVAQMCANKAVDHYRSSGSASGRGKMFDDCFRIAKAWAMKYQPKKK